MTEQLAALFSHHPLSGHNRKGQVSIFLVLQSVSMAYAPIAVIPDRVWSRAAHVLNESPPANVGTLKT
jgi:hypothetical protein